jgi:hypothetical protein
MAIGPFRAQQTTSRLLDHFVGAARQGERDRDAEGLGGICIDEELEFGALLDR